MPGGASHLAVVDQAKNNLKKLETYITTGMDNTIEIALDLVEYDKDKCEELLADLRKVMEEYVLMEQQLKDFVESIDEVKTKARESDGKVALEEVLNENLDRRLQARVNTDLRRHDKFVDMEQRIEDMKHAGASTEKSGDKTPTQIDDDVAMTQQEINTRCPYTGKEMQNPVKNIRCGHNYEREGIEKYIKQRKGKAKCPVPGCINESPLDLNDLEENKEIKRFIELKNRQNRKGKKH